MSRRLKMSYCDHSPSVVVVVRLSVRPSTIFKQHLLLNHWLEFDQTSPLDGVQYNFAEMFLWWSSKDCSSHLDSSKNMAARERGLFSLYIYIENLKNLLVRNHWTDFHIILQKCSFGDPLPRLFKPLGFVKKHGRRGRGLFSLYIYIENLKHLLVRNH